MMSSESKIRPSQARSTPAAASPTIGSAYVASGERLSARQEVELIRRVQEGDESARERVFRANIPLVVSIARRYTSQHLESEDLVQEGMIGLCTAIERFDPSRGFRFSTYATYWIRQRILRALDQNSRLIHVPVDVGYAARHAAVKREELERQLGREPTLAELAPHCGVTETRLEAILACLEDPVSIEGRPGEEGEGGVLNIPDTDAVDPVQALFASETERQAQRLLATLSARDRLVIENRYGINGQTLSLQDLAERLRITREGVRQIQRRALQKLQRAMQQMELQSA